MNNLDNLSSKKIWVMVGTRPEVIKQVPVYLECKKKFGEDQVALIGTGQHRELLDQALNHFKVELDYNFEIMRKGQSLNQIAASVLVKMDSLLRVYSPEWVIVQGDTTSAAMAGLSAFHHKVKVIHNEAGLRSYDLANPFPEEANRLMLGSIATLHMAPTPLAAGALEKEGISSSKIFITGNTGLDSLRMTLQMPIPEETKKLIDTIHDKGLDLVFLTAHRRENEGKTMDQWFQALGKFMEDNPKLFLLYPMHPNNLAKSYAEKYLGNNPRVKIINAINYLETAHILNNAKFVVTDSGGIQEEASTIGVPVVICRKTTERMEAVHAGSAVLAGGETESILIAMKWAYDKANNTEKKWQNIFGDGHSAATIADIISSPQWFRNNVEEKLKRLKAEANNLISLKQA